MHCCGFDSVPSDLGVLLLHQAARVDGTGDLAGTTLVVTALRGGISAWTLASGMGQWDEAAASAERRRVVEDPYALSPDRAAEPDLGDERDLDWVSYDSGLATWVGPFLMAGLNTRVVRQQQCPAGLGLWPPVPLPGGHRLRRQPGRGRAGRRVQHRAEGRGGRARIWAIQGAIGQLLPVLGEGPGEKTRRRGFFRMQIHTRTSAGVRYLAKIEARGDPGYAATSVMLGESALCLALDRNRLPDHAGVLTPATAMGAALADRLRSAGHTLAVRQTTQ